MELVKKYQELQAAEYVCPECTSTFSANSGDVLSARMHVWGEMGYTVICPACNRNVEIENKRRKSGNNDWGCAVVAVLIILACSAVLWACNGM